MRIVFMGTPDFAVPSLEALITRGDTVVGVFTQPDKPKGRGKADAAPGEGRSGGARHPRVPTPPHPQGWPGGLESAGS